MSHHLRAPGKCGLIQRAEARDGARKRPWVRAGDTRSIDLEGSDGAGSSLAAVGLQVENSLQRDRQRLLAAMRADAGVDTGGRWKATRPTPAGSCS